MRKLYYYEITDFNGKVNETSFIERTEEQGFEIEKDYINLKNHLFSLGNNNPKYKVVEEIDDLQKRVKCTLEVGKNEYFIRTVTLFGHK